MKALNRIAFIDDEMHIREIVKLALEELGGFKIRCFESGMDALDGIEGFDPDLILLDVMMPKMTGIETLCALRELPACAETPVIFVTAKAQRHEIEHYMEVGAAGVIPKPFDPITLPDNLNAIWCKAKTQALSSHAGTA